MITTSRNLSLALALTLLSSHHASSFSSFTPPPKAAKDALSLESQHMDGADHSSKQRRAILSSLLTVTSTTFSGISPAYAGLLEDYGADPNVNKEPEKKKEQARNKGKKESNMEPNLRSNYYYPTNKGMLR